MEPFLSYDEVYVVSDIHLGGQPGFQVFSLGKTLAGLIKHLADADSGEKRQVALVIAGDFIDFLAESPARTFDPDGAVKKLHDIAEREAFRPVFRALQHFTSRPDRHLVVVLGNHDLELALPWVAEQLLELLSGGKLTARARIRLCFDGCGFLCGVGGKRVLVVHGNEVDTWNLCDHEHLRRTGRDLIQGNRVEAWVPNAGSKMVIDVMNSIKKEYPFVDLLKPEQEAAVPLLLAIDPSVAGKMPGVLAAKGRQVWDGLRKRTGFLSADAEPSQELLSAANAELDQIMRRTLAMTGSQPEGSSDELLDRVEDRMLRGETANDALSRDRDQQYLGIGGAVWGALHSESREEVVRKAFSGLKEDRSFLLTDKDQTFTDLDKQVGADIDVLVAGHTHLERALPRNNGAGVYLNTGTWIRLIQLTDELLDDQEQFAKVFAALSAGSMQDLDECKYSSGGSEHSLVLQRPVVAAIRKHQGGVRAELLRVALDSGLPGTVVGGA